MAAYLKRISIIGAAILLNVTRTSGEMADGEPVKEADMWMMGARLLEDMTEGEESGTEYMEDDDDEQMKDMSTTDDESMTTMIKDSMGGGSTTTMKMVSSTMGEDDDDDESMTTMSKDSMGGGSTTTMKMVSSTMGEDHPDDDGASTTKMMMTSSMADKNMLTVQGSLTIEGLTYADVVANQSLKDGVIAGCRTAVADEAGQEISPEHVSCTLSPGSVQADFSITPPEGVDASALANGIDGVSLGQAMVAEIEAVPGIDAATTGTLSATNVVVSAVVATTSSMMEASTTSAGMAAPTTKEAEVHQNSHAAERKMLPVLALLCVSAFLF